jgi:hypothetical protein
MRNPKYQIGERVYHITPESETGIVLDARFSLRENAWSYIVTFGPDKDSLLYYEDELTTSRIF